MRLPLSVCILTYNEEANLSDCLASVRELADEIVILDSGSQDQTSRIAEKFGARFIVHPFDDFGSQYNRLFSLATHEWILNLDADERLTPELAQSIQDVFSKKNNLMEFQGFSFNRLNYFIGKPIRHSGWAPDPLVRLFRKDSGEMERRKVHVQILVRGKIGTLAGNFLHYTYRSLDSYLQKSIQYARLAAMEMKKNGRTPSLFPLFTHPIAMAFKMYILKKGFLDGKEGVFLAILYSYYTFLKYLYLYYL
ncbi:glycosyltransferase family 2 protein [Leptospirillum ferriphilum]|jgi:(heptosyl)LPS beta-1,4-glucosyltransferase|uniref:Dolichol-phosphate mannosyltransferase n=2 Tax=Leptospirillum TaxID=179 RepID=A0A094YJU3_9BACT|nr:glycosyltransferase family 2 protein [Leptospirillum ferriphilum]EDZ38969.1 MAG: glycosyltransferase [Leptospirillum sp. Group II '5-way CG']KGA93471.1 Dolichol-phosphate mannosyltransferase [Leptospirillum ferriphilum]